MKEQNSIKSVSAYLDNEYLAYAKYVVENRAIPSVIDGFKPTQRKIIFTANRAWKSGSEKPLKIFQLSGKVAAESFYHHGNASLDAAITGMAQSFKNSMPLLEEIGQFGSLRSPEAGAPRYISTKLSKNFRLLYKDFELLTPRMEEGNEIEPEYFLPIIPTVLLNGSSGIAVGFATNILNRNPLDLIDACLAVVNGKKYKEPLPWWKDFKGKVEKVQDTESSFVFRGEYSIKDTTTVEITELPPSMTFEKYENILNTFTEKGWIRGYEDNCSNGINYAIKFGRAELKKHEPRLEQILKLAESETENLTCLDEHGKLIIFKNVDEIIRYFVKFRLSYYDKRKQYYLDLYNRELTWLSNRARFIKMVVDGKLKINNIPKAQIEEQLDKNKFDRIDGTYSYLLSMPIHSLTKERIEELLKEVESKKVEIEEIKKLTSEEWYKQDLNALKKSLQK
jgi:DNA topoisomerase-2